MARTPGFLQLQKLLRLASRSSVQMPVTRREFIKSTLALGALTLPAAVHAKPPKKIQGDPVIILGGGIAGLVTAYRLNKAGVPCEIYEASSRLGGRVFTQTQFNSEGMYCEAGAELIDSNHEDLIQLCRE